MDLIKDSKGDIEMEESTVVLTKEKLEKEAAMGAAKVSEAKAAETKEKYAARMAVLHHQKGQRENEEADVDLTKSDEEDNGAEEDDDDNNGLENCVWKNKLHPANTTQREKKQTYMAWKKTNLTTVLYIEARGTQGTTPLKVIRNTVAKVFTEISVHG